jgi:integrase
VSDRFQRCSLLKESRKGTADVWVLRFYESTEGKRKYRRQIIGTVTELPLKAQLSVRDRAMVLLAGSTGLRRSELIR